MQNRAVNMYKLGLLRKGIAVAGIVPLTLFGLAACAGTAGDDLDERTRAPKATAPEGEAAPSEADTSDGLPFPFAEGGEDSNSSNDSADASGTGGDNGTGGSGASGDSGSGNSSGGGNGVVKYDDVDLSHVNWSTICSTDADAQYVLASDEDSTADSTGPTLMISADETGQPDYLFISEGGDSAGASSLYWSGTADGGSVSMSFSGDEFTATGEAFYFDDYSYNNPIEFEVTLTCDVTY